MLDKYKSYKKELKEKKEFFEKIKPIVYMIAFLLIVLGVILLRNESSNVVDVSALTTTSDQIIPLVNKLTDNYTEKITITKGINSTEQMYQIEGSTQIFDYDENTEYMIYNNQTYKINPDTYKAEKTSKEIKKDPLSDIEFLKNILPYCNFEYENSTNSTCELDLYTFMNEYNKYTNSDYYGSDDTIYIKVTYYSTHIHAITIDYSNANKKINGSYDGLTYKMNFIDINNTNCNSLASIVLNK